MKARLSKHKKGEGILISFIQIMHLFYFSFDIEHACCLTKSARNVQYIGCLCAEIPTSAPGDFECLSGEEFHLVFPERVVASTDRSIHPKR